MFDPNSPNTVLQFAPRMSPEQLKQMAQQHAKDPNGVLWASYALAAQKRQQAAAPQQGPQPTVAQQMGFLPEQQGIGQLPAPNMVQMAGGGLVAFAGDAGSFVDDEDTPQKQVQRLLNDKAGLEREIALTQKNNPAWVEQGKQQDRMSVLQGELQKKNRQITALQAAIRQPSAAQQGAATLDNGPSAWGMAPAGAGMAAYGVSKAMPAINSALQSATGMSGVTAGEVARQVGSDVMGAAKKAAPALPTGKLAGLGALGALAGTGVDTARTSTDDYRKRFGAETDDPSFAGDLMYRSLGAASDLGNAATFGYLGSKLFRDKQPDETSKKAPVAGAGRGLTNPPVVRPNKDRPITSDYTPDETAGAGRGSINPTAVNPDAPAPSMPDPAVVKQVVEDKLGPERTSKMSNDAMLRFFLNLAAGKSQHFAQNVGDAGINTLNQLAQERKQAADEAYQKSHGSYFDRQAATAEKDQASKESLNKAHEKWWQQRGDAAGNTDVADQKVQAQVIAAAQKEAQKRVDTFKNSVAGIGATQAQLDALFKRYYEESIASRSGVAAMQALPGPTGPAEGAGASMPTFSLAGIR